MKYSLCGMLIGLETAYIKAIKAKLQEIPKVDYWLKDSQLSKTVNEQGENVVVFAIQFHKATIRNSFVKNWIKFYWKTEMVKDPETGEETEITVRKFQVKDAIKTLWSKCKAGSRIWVEMHDHDEEVRSGCKIEDIIKK